MLGTVEVKVMTVEVMHMLTLICAVKNMGKYRVRQRGYSLTHSVCTPPARDVNIFFWQGIFLGQGIFWGAGDFSF